MQQNNRFIIYRIFYGDTLVYIGRTKQPLQSRIHGHLFKNPMQRSLFIDQISRIEYAVLPSEADMNLYELYYINLWKPPLNVDDKSKDALTVRLPELQWDNFTTPLWTKWQKEIAESDKQYKMRQQEKAAFEAAKRIMHKRFACNEITEDQYADFLDQNTPESKALMWSLYLGSIESTSSFASLNGTST